MLIEFSFMYGNTRVIIKSIPYLRYSLCQTYNYPLQVKSFWSPDLCRFAAFISITIFCFHLLFFLNTSLSGIGSPSASQNSSTELIWSSRSTSWHTRCPLLVWGIGNNSDQARWITLINKRNNGIDLSRWSWECWSRKFLGNLGLGYRVLILVIVFSQEANRSEMIFFENVAFSRLL